MTRSAIGAKRDCASTGLGARTTMRIANKNAKMAWSTARLTKSCDGSPAIAIDATIGPMIAATPFTIISNIEAAALLVRDPVVRERNAKSVHRVREATHESDEHNRHPPSGGRSCECQQQHDCPSGDAQNDESSTDSVRKRSNRKLEHRCSDDEGADEERDLSGVHADPGGVDRGQATEDRCGPAADENRDHAGRRNRTELGESHALRDDDWWC